MTQPQDNVTWINEKLRQQTFIDYYHYLSVNIFLCNPILWKLLAKKIIWNKGQHTEKQLVEFDVNS